MDQILRDAHAITHLTAAAPMAKPQLRDTITKVVDANTLPTDAVPMRSQLLLVRRMKVVPATHSNSDAALMVLPLPLDPTTKDATARTANSSAAQTTSHQLKDPTARDAHALPASSAAVLMDHPKLKERTLRVARRRFPTQPRKLAASTATWVTAAKTTPSNTSSTPSMAVAVASGMVDAEEIRTDSTPKASARILALSQSERMFANCPRFTDPALDITQCGTTTATETHARSSSMEDVLEMLIDLRNLKIAKLNVFRMIRFVSRKVFFFVCKRNLIYL